MNVSVKHHKEIPEVRKNMDRLAKSMNMSIEWSPDSTNASGVMNYAGFTIPGKISISASSVTLNVELPMVARMRSGKISSEIKKQLEQALS